MSEILPELLTPARAEAAAVASLLWAAGGLLVFLGRWLSAAPKETPQYRAVRAAMKDPSRWKVRPWKSPSVFREFENGKDNDYCPSAEVTGTHVLLSGDRVDKFLTRRERKKVLRAARLLHAALQERWADGVCRQYETGGKA